MLEQHKQRAENMNQGFSLVRRALGLLERIDQSLLQLVRTSTDRPRDALGEGVTPGVVTVGANGVSGSTGPNVLEANPARRGSNWQNTSPAGGPTITLGLGVRQPTPGAGIVLPPGASWDGRISGLVWTGSVAPIASAAGASLAYAEA